MGKIKKALLFIADSFKFVIGGIFKIIFGAFWFIIKPIVRPKNDRSKARVAILFLLILAIAAFFYNYPVGFNNFADKINAGKNNLAKSERLIFKSKGFDQWLGGWQFPYFYSKEFTLGLDLKGGTHLVYLADLSSITPENYNDSMEGIKDVVERRVNAYGIAEPIVQISKIGSERRLIVDLADVKDANEAVKMIGETPFLEFKEEKTQEEIELEKQANQTTETAEKADASGNESKKEDSMQIEALDSAGNPVGVQTVPVDNSNVYIDPFKSTGLNGKYLQKAEVVTNPYTSEPQVSLQFDSDGKKLFSEITQRNVGKRVAIFLDGVPISMPVVNDPILDGKAVIQGSFNIEEAKQLAQRLNAGALPVPIKLIGQQTIGATLGKASLDKSLKAGAIGLLAVMVFMLLYYRFLGLLADLALLVYALLSLAIFKLLPVTLTLPGIAGFILSIGMAVDANVLIFERIKEELADSRKTLQTAVEEGFSKAWPSIRDGNFSTLISCAILFMFASSSVKGFALTLIAGILVSMFSAIIVTKAFVKYAIFSKVFGWTKKIKFLWKSGI
ncbi:MAG: protein translocase subunit SecD [bacterium]